MEWMWIPLAILAWFAGLALLGHGWPSFITINKHYHGDDKDV
jgi:hypothetical protein